MKPIIFDRNILSNILDIVCKLKFAVFGFFCRGVTRADL